MANQALYDLQAIERIYIIFLVYPKTCEWSKTVVIRVPTPEQTPDSKNERERLFNSIYSLILQFFPISSSLLHPIDTYSLSQYLDKKNEKYNMNIRQFQIYQNSN